MLVFPIGLYSATAASGSLLLDSIGTSAAAAYGLRKLRTAYSGSAIRIIRASDSTEQDIGFSGNDLDTSAIGTFCSGTTGKVKTWYDQSGNARDATQSSDPNRPTIYTGGAVVTKNSKPAMRFVSINFLPTYKFAAPSTNFSFLMCGSSDSVTNNTNNSLGSDGKGYGFHGIYIQFVSTNTTVAFSNATATFVNGSTNATAGTLSTIGNIHTSSNAATTYFNGGAGSQVTGISWTDGTKGTFNVGEYEDATGPTNRSSISLTGYITEHVCYSAALSGGDLTTLHNDMKTYYGTP